MADQSRPDQLFQRYLNKTATPEEELELMAFAADPEFADTLKELIGGAFIAHKEEVALPSERTSEILHHIFTHQEQELQNTPVIRSFPWKRLAVAASIIFTLSFGGYFLLNKSQDIKQVQTQKNDFAAGGNKAMLTLANGQKIALSDAKIGVLANQGNTVINKTGAGRLAYNVNDKSGLVKENLTNSIETPYGGQYQVKLPDGSAVWLNSKSSITFPTTFNGADRVVSITGEAYFEVTHNRHKPFSVRVAGQVVQVLGTHFNINAYTDEKVIKTTLLEGSVNVSNAEHNALLKPGQESAVVPGTTTITVKNADTEAAVAWKNGLFSFSDADLRTVMRQLARWYNAEVYYEGEVPARRFNGKIDKSLTLVQVLNGLTKQRVKYKIEGNRITIFPSSSN